MPTMPTMAAHHHQRAQPSWPPHPPQPPSGTHQHDPHSAHHHGIQWTHGAFPLDKQNERRHPTRPHLYMKKRHVVGLVGLVPSLLAMLACGGWYFARASQTSSKEIVHVRVTKATKESEEDAWTFDFEVLRKGGTSTALKNVKMSPPFFPGDAPYTVGMEFKSVYSERNRKKTDNGTLDPKSVDKVQALLAEKRVALWCLVGACVSALVFFALVGPVEMFSVLSWCFAFLV